MMVIFLFWIVIVALTTGIYLLVFPEYKLLFGINLGVVIFVETIIMYNVKMLTLKREPHYVLQQIILLVYAIALLAWTIIFTSTSPKEPYIDLYIGMIALTLITAFALGVSHISGKAVNHQETALISGEGKKKEALSMLSEVRRRLETSELGANVISDWIRIEDRVKSIPINTFNSTTKFMVDYENRVWIISKHAEEITGCDDKSELSQQLSKEISELKRYVTFYKPNI